MKAPTKVLPWKINDPNVQTSDQIEAALAAENGLVMTPAGGLAPQQAVAPQQALQPPAPQWPVEPIVPAVQQSVPQVPPAPPVTAQVVPVQQASLIQYDLPPTPPKSYLEASEPAGIVPEPTPAVVSPEMQQRLAEAQAMAKLREKENEELRKKYEDLEKRIQAINREQQREKILGDIDTSAFQNFRPEEVTELKQRVIDPLADSMQQQLDQYGESISQRAEEFERRTSEIVSQKMQERLIQDTEAAAKRAVPEFEAMHREFNSTWARLINAPVVDTNTGLPTKQTYSDALGRALVEGDVKYVESFLSFFVQKCHQIKNRSSQNADLLEEPSTGVSTGSMATATTAPVNADSDATISEQAYIAAARKFRAGDPSITREEYRKIQAQYARQNGLAA